MKTEIRPLWKDVLAAIWLGMVLPGIVLHACVLLQRKIPEPAREFEQLPVTESRNITLLSSRDGSRNILEINQYLTGVLLAEMPSAFPEEALKAQAVAARTYTEKAFFTGGKHGDGSVCDSPACCQGFITVADYLSRGGIQESVDKVSKAVADTAPLVIQYHGELIEAVYFSSSGGKTESALAVWGTDFPYLQSVDSYGEEAVSYDNRLMTMDLQEFQNRLDLQLTEESGNWFSNVTFTDGGGVESMVIGGKEFTGVRLRELLNLPSTVFSITAEDSVVRIVTSGYGHRVGLSQYGASAMASAGKSFREILAHYYPGTVLVPVS